MDTAYCQGGKRTLGSRRQGGGGGEWAWLLRIPLENDASDDFRGWRSSISKECVELQALSRETVHYYKSVVGSLRPL